MEEIRLQKYISECGVMSRRAAEGEIRNGNVTINGIPAQLGDKVIPGQDVVRLYGELVEPKSAAHTYIMLNKPAGYVTTLSDEEGRQTICDLLPKEPRVYPVGRLDLYSSGLLLCTDDGDLTNRLTHPSHDVAKVYRAIITDRLTDDDLARLSEQIELDGYRIRPVEIKRAYYTTVNNAPATVVLFTLHEGRNRQIRRMCAYHGYRLISLTRIRIGDLTLGNLQKGEWRYLTEEEVAYLKQF